MENSSGNSLKLNQSPLFGWLDGTKIREIEAPATLSMFIEEENMTTSTQTKFSPICWLPAKVASEQEPLLSRASCVMDPPLVTKWISSSTLLKLNLDKRILLIFSPLGLNQNVSNED
ncbi:uncharacterized protein LOC144196381 [Stigmatopora nigra]